jgi:CheY-like chemotaxis protein
VGRPWDAAAPEARHPAGRGHGDGNGNADRTNPEAPAPLDPPAPPKPIRPAPVRSPLVDDRSHIRPGDLVLLVIDDDTVFGRLLLERARHHGFKVVVASGGEAGLGLARDLRPSAVTLDINLPGMNGWAVLDRLKHDPAVRHIPVHILSVTDDAHCAMKQGARGFLQKPSASEGLDGLLADLKEFLLRPKRNLLVVEDDQTQLNSVIELLDGDDVDAVGVASAEEALAAMRVRKFDCVVLDLGLPEMNGHDLLDYIRDDPKLAAVPVVIYTARDLTKAERERLQPLTESIIVKDATSPERLLEETALFLHRDEAKLPPLKRQMIEQARRNDPALLGTKVLIVDDDVRNVFALTAALEQRFGMSVIYADNGIDGIELLKNTPRVDVVLMDVMMPGVDGYETIRRMRKLPGHGDIPIIAVTAKAMKGDREKCIEAGASDYIAKPVDTDQLASLIRVWVGDPGRERTKCEPEGAVSS